MKTILIAFLLLLPFHPSEEHTILLEIQKPERVAEPLPTHLQIFNSLTANGIDTLTAKILVAQASMESGKFDNRLTREHWNVFSIMHSNNRETLSLGPFGYAEGRYGYCSYLSLDSASVDMILYMKARKIPMKWKSTSAYCKYLKKRGYYEDDPDKYTRAVWTTYKKLWN